MVVPKSSFAKAVDSIAAMKLHDYALKRKERMRNRFRLWDEIKGTARELEISSAEVAFMEFQEIIAAWKIKYYISKFREREKLNENDREKKALIRQCKNLKRKNGQLQSSIDAHLALNLADEAKRLIVEKAALEDTLSTSRRTVLGLEDEIEHHKKLYSDLENVLADQRKAAEEEAAANANLLEDAKAETAMVKEDLEVSRRTAQEYLRNVMQLEISLQERIDEITGLREGDLQESAQKSIRIKAMDNEIEGLTQKGRADEEQIQALEQSVEGLQFELTEVKKKLKEAVTETEVLDKANRNLKTHIEEQQFTVNSLEKLVTEVTYQKEQLSKELEEKGVVAGNYLIETVQLKDEVAARDNELEEHKFALSQMEEYTKYAQQVNDIANMERESALMHGEDLLVQLQMRKETLRQNEDYCRMLEAQVLNARRREHYSRAQSAGDVPLSRPNTEEGQGTTNIFNEKIDFKADETANAFVHPLEDRLVSLMSVLEERISSLGGSGVGVGGDANKEKGSRRKSIPQLPKETSNDRDLTRDRAHSGTKDETKSDVVDGGKLGDIEKTKDKENDVENKAVAEKGNEVSNIDGGAEEKAQEDEEVDWEEVCIVLEEKLANEKSKLESLKQQLAAARENIQRTQKEKEKLKGDIKKWQKNEQKRTGKMPTVRGNSVDSRNLFTRSDEVEAEMQKYLVEAQTIATDALNCKMECDRIQDELYEADAEAYEVRLAAQQKQIAEQQKLSAVMKDQQSQQPLPTRPKRNENRATISMLNQDHFTSAPKKDDTDLEVLREEDEEEDDESTAVKSGSEFLDKTENRAERKHPFFMNENSTSLTAASMDSSELVKIDSEYGALLNKDVLDMEATEQLFRLIHVKLNYHHAVLLELEEEKNVIRRQIEKWTLFFLRDQGRVPGLSDSKYGANNLIFHNFNSVESDIYTHHQTIQNIFRDFDSKREAILNSNNQRLTEQVMQVEQHFDDPLFSLPENEEYEDAFKLHFESVENALLEGVVDDNTIRDEDYLPNNTLVFDEIDNTGKLEILENLSADIKSFQDDVAELHISLQDSRENAERLHDSLKFQKNKIKQWHERFEKKFNRVPTEEDKEKEASHLYMKAHEVHSELEAEMEKMRVFALIATAKNTEADRLKVLKRKFARKAPPDYVPSEDSSVASSLQYQGSTLSQLQTASADLREHSKNTFDSKMPSIRSDASESEFRELRESIESEIVKMSDELDMLKNFIRSADKDIDRFRSKKAKLKSDAKKWEQAFQQKHGHKPTVEQRKVQAEDLYEEYANIQEGLSQALESRERALKMVTKIEHNCDRRRRKLAKVVEKERLKFPRE